MPIFGPTKIWNKKGFSLVELLIVVALITLIAAFAMPTVSSYFRISLNSVTRELATVIRESYHSSATTGRVHRLVYDLGKKEYWVEVEPKTAMLDSEQSRERQERKNRFKTEKEKKKPSEFEIEQTVTRDKVKLPAGVSFREIFTHGKEESQKEGLVYTHFFPHGVTERTIIYLKDDQEHEVTLVISALVGRTKLFNHRVPREKIDGKY